MIRRTTPKAGPRARVADPGYSGTPLPIKLGFREGMAAAFGAAPAGFRDSLEPLPPGVHVPKGTDRPLDIALLFATSATDLARAFPRWMARLAPAGMLWIAWPKRASGVTTDLTENVVRAIGLEAGLVDVKVCAIDATWSGLKFVRRLRDRT